MSRNPDKAFVEAFDDDVKHAYQGGEVLDGIAYKKTNIGAESCQFQSMGKSTMQDHSRGSKFEPADTPHENAVATLSDKRWSDDSDLFDQDKMDVNERQELAKVAGKAMGREEDQVCYDTIDNRSTTYQASDNSLIEESTGSNSAFNIEKLREAMFVFDNQEVEKDDRYIIWSPASARQLLGTTEATSSDFNTVQTLVRGDMNDFLGFEFRKLSTNRDEGGLTVDSGTHHNYAVHGRSVGIASGTGPRTDVDWSPEYAVWIVQAFLSLGGTVIDDEGQIRIESDGSATV